MNRPNFRWYHFRFVLVGLLIFSVLGSFNVGSLIPSLVDFCFVDDSVGLSNTSTQLFDEGKAGEEWTEKDIDDDFEEKPLFGDAETSGLAVAILGFSRRSFQLTYADRHKHTLNGRPIYLSYHSLLI